MAGLRGFVSHGAVFHLWASWPQWKPLGILYTYLPLKRGSWLNLVKCNLTKLTTTRLAVKRFTSLAGKQEQAKTEDVPKNVGI